MFETGKALRALLGIAGAIVALGMGWVFWVYFTHGMFIVIPFMLGYIYIAVNLARFKKWAWQVFLLIIIFTIIMEVLFVFVGGVREGLLEWFHILIVIVSSVVMTVFGISALVRRIVKKRQ